MAMKICDLNLLKRAICSLQNSTTLTISYGKRGVKFLKRNSPYVSHRYVETFSVSDESDTEKWLNMQNAVVVSNTASCIIIIPGRMIRYKDSQPFDGCPLLKVAASVGKSLLQQENINLLMDLPEIHLDEVYIIIPQKFLGYDESGYPLFEKIDF